MSEPLTNLIDRFCAEYHSFNGITERRRHDQRRVLGLLQEHLAPIPVTEVRATDLRGFLIYCMEDLELHPNTVYKYLKMIRPLYRWAYESGEIDADTFMQTRLVRAPKGAHMGAPRPYTRKELDRFWTALDLKFPEEPRWLDRFVAGKSPWRRARKYATRRQFEAIVGLALWCGLRRAEIFNLDLADMHPHNAYVVVQHRKGGKPGAVPYAQEARLRIGRWLQVRDALQPTHDRPWLRLWGSDRYNEPMPWKRFDSGTFFVPVPGDWQLHRFRHTCATEWLRAGMTLEAVSRLLGHSNISQTLRYAELVKDDIARAVRTHEAAFSEAVGPRSVGNMQ